MKRNFDSNVSHGNLHCAPVQTEEIGRLLVGDPFEGDAQFPLLPPDLQRDFCSEINAKIKNIIRHNNIFYSHSNGCQELPLKDDTHLHHDSTLIATYFPLATIKTSSVSQLQKHWHPPAHVNTTNVYIT